MESYSCFHRFEVAADKNIRQQTCCLYVLWYNSPRPWRGPKSNLHHLPKISTGKYIMAVLPPKSGIVCVGISRSLSQLI